MRLKRINKKTYQYLDLNKLLHFFGNMIQLGYAEYGYKKY